MKDEAFDHAHGGASHSRSSDAERTAIRLDEPGLFDPPGDRLIYDWDLVHDRLRWSGDVRRLLGDLPPQALKSGRALAEELSGDVDAGGFVGSNVAPGGQCFYRTIYRLRRSDDRALAIEDSGRLFVGASGFAVAAHGLLRLVRAPMAKPARETSSFVSADDGPPPLSQFLHRADVRLLRAAGDASSFAMVVVALPSDIAVLRSARRAVEAALVRRLRAGDLFARRGVDKYVALLRADRPQALSAARGLLRDLFEQRGAGRPLVVARAGLAFAPDHGFSALSLLRKAEDAIASQPAGPQCVVHAPERAASHARRRDRDLGDAILAALNQRRLGLAYQPVADLNLKGAWRRAFEVRYRLGLEDGTLLAPTEAGPVADAFGLTPLLDQRVVELSIAELRRQRDLRLSLTLSPASLTQSFWFDALQAAPDLAPRLTLELPARALAHHWLAATAAARRIKVLGSRLAIEEFAGAPSALPLLRRIGVDEIRIDGALLQNLANSLEERHYVRCLADAARNEGVTALAKDTVHAENLRFLTTCGIACAVGPLVGEPQAAPPEPTRAGRGEDGLARRLDVA